MAPSTAQVGDRIPVALSYPPLSGVATLDTQLNYDTAHLKLVRVVESDMERNRLNGLRFGHTLINDGVVKLELAAARGEVLPPTTGTLAMLEFEVLAPAGLTSIKLAKTNAVNMDNLSALLPAAMPVEIEVRSEPKPEQKPATKLR